MQCEVRLHDRVLVLRPHEPCGTLPAARTEGPSRRGPSTVQDCAPPPRRGGLLVPTDRRAPRVLHQARVPAPGARTDAVPQSV